MTDDTRDDQLVAEPVEGSGLGLVREVTALPDGRRITFYSCGDSDG